MKHMLLNVESNYTYSENGNTRESMSMKADYDGKELDIDISDNLRNKKTTYQLSNDELINLMSHNQTDESLLHKLEKELAHPSMRSTKKHKRATQKKRLVKSSKSGKEKRNKRKNKNTRKKSH